MALPSALEHHLTVLEGDSQKVLQHLRRIEANEQNRAAADRAVTDAVLQAIQELDEHLETLVGRLGQSQDLAMSAAEARHASLWQFLTDQHGDITRLLIERSGELTGLVRHLRFFIDDRLNRLALARLPARNSPEVPPATVPATSTMAASVRDFLGLATDEDPPTVRRRAGQVEVELPAWDNVIGPWLATYHEWEPAVTQALTQLAQPGYIILDVGAHVGIFTLLASRLVGPRGRVIALEPDPLTARFLRRNIMRAASANVLVLEIAAADESGVLPLSRPDTDNTGDSRTYSLPSAREHLSAPAVALDDLLPSFARVDLVKFDLQGMDHVALRGMGHLLAQQKPVIILEFWPEGIRAYGDDPSEVIHWLRTLQYSWYALELPALTDACSDEEIRLAVETFPLGYVNLLLTPKQQIAAAAVEHVSTDS
jgi:FkbM family methyltransferase